jgi:hypothetical protein
MDDPDAFGGEYWPARARPRPERTTGAGPAPRHGRRRGCIWLAAILGAVGGALLSAAVTIGMLVFAGPRPSPLPVASGSGSVTLTVDDAFIATALRQALANGLPGYSIANVRAHCVPGDRILLGADAAGPFAISAPVYMNLQPVASQGYFTVHVLDARVGGLTLPAAADAQIEQAANNQLRSLGSAALAGPSQYVVTGVTTTTGHATVTLGPQPQQ